MSESKDTEENDTEDSSKKTQKFKDFKKKVEDKDDPTSEVGGIGCIGFCIWGAVFWVLALYNGWLGIFAASLWTAVYWSGANLFGMILGLILNSLTKNSAFMFFLAYAVVYAGLGWMLCTSYDLSLPFTIALHVLFVLSSGVLTLRMVTSAVAFEAACFSETPRRR